MDQRIESFPTDVPTLAGEDLDAIREGVRSALADCEAIFRAQEKNKRMKDKAAHACRTLCRARVADELQRRRATRIAEHLKLVLSIIDRQGRAPLFGVDGVIHLRFIHRSLASSCVVAIGPGVRHE
jgi:hypothetical protein